MSGEAMLRHAATVVAENGKAYGSPVASMAPAQVVMGLIDLKFTRLAPC